MKYLTLCLLITSLFLAPEIRSDAPDWLEPWYQGYNVLYFNQSLPTDVVITHELEDDHFMGISYRAGGRYWIEMNLKYEPSPKQSKLILLHEMCHVDLWVEGEDEPDDHGPKWQHCMHGLANMRAFESLW